MFEDEEEQSASEHVALAGAGVLRCLLRAHQPHGGGARHLLDLWHTELYSAIKDVRQNAERSV